MKHAIGSSYQNINLEDATAIDFETGQSVNFDEMARKKIREELELRQSSVQLQQRNRCLSAARTAHPHHEKQMVFKFVSFVGSDFKVVENRLKEIETYTRQEDFSCETSDFAKQIVNSIVREAYKQTPNIVVAPVVAADGIGGLKFDWRKNDKEVRISIPANPNSPTYIYFRGETDDIIDNPSSQILSEKLAWLNS